MNVLYKLVLALAIAGSIAFGTIAMPVPPRTQAEPDNQAPNVARRTLSSSRTALAA